jgi:hypothetical protein
MGGVEGAAVFASVCQERLVWRRIQTSSDQIPSPVVAILVQVFSMTATDHLLPSID